MSAVVQAGMNDAVIRVNAAVSTQTARSYCQLHPANGGNKQPELFCWVKVFHLTNRRYCTRLFFELFSCSSHCENEKKSV